MMRRFLHILTDFASDQRGKFVVMGTWLLLVLLLTLFTPQLANLSSSETSQSLPANAPSQVAQDLLLRQFPVNRGTPAILVFTDPAGLTIQDRSLIHQLNDWLNSSARPRPVSAVVSVYDVPEAAGQLISADGTTMMLVVQLQGDPSGPQMQQAVQQIRARVAATLAGSPLQGRVTGPARVLTDLVTIFRSVDLKLLVTTIGLVFVLLPLGAVAVASQVANALLALFIQAHLTSVSQAPANIATVLLFGAGTDYGLFIASRFREELQRTPDKHEAMRQTMRAVGEAITSSAGTVIALSS